MEGELARWVREELRRRGHGGRDLTFEEASKQTGLSQPTFTRVLRGEMPNAQTCLLLAPWLHRSETEVLRAAGRPVNAPAQAVTSEETILQRRLLEVFDQLPAVEQEKLIRRAEFEASLLTEREPAEETEHEGTVLVASG